LNKDLIERCRKGDKLALEQLYNFYAPKMKSICLRYARSKSEADDIFQDSFFKVLKNIKTYEYKGSFEGWIRKIVVHTAINHYKKNLTYLSKHISYEDANAEQTEDESCDLVNHLSANELMEIIKKIPPGYNMVFNLFAIEGYDHSEIAELLQITESASRSQLSRARTFIINILRQYNYVPNEKKKA
jgi:RNA polymerase sigma-70 factor (ECF subfamily)